MARKEKLIPQEPEKKAGKSEPDKSSQDSPLAFLEQIATLFKLRLLKEKLGVDAVDQNKLNELQVKLDGDRSQKSEAEREIGKIYKKVVEVDEASFHKDMSLESTLQKSTIRDGELLDKARKMDTRMQMLRKKSPGSIAKVEVDRSLADMIDLADSLKINVKVDKRQIDQVVSNEIGELHNLRDAVQITQQRDEIREVGTGLKKVAKDKMKVEILKAEDFKKKPSEKARVMKVKRGNKKYQKEADQYVATLKRDFEGDQLERMDETSLAEGLLRSKAQNRSRLIYGDGFEGIKKADELTFTAGLIYSDRLIDQIVRRELRGVPEGSARDLLEIRMRAEATNGILEAWVSRRRDITPDEVIKLVEVNLRARMGTEQSVDDQNLKRTKPSPYDVPQMGGQGHHQGGGNRETEALDAMGIDMASISRAFSEKKREFDRRGVVGQEHRQQFGEEFMADLDKLYPGLDERTYKYLYSEATSMFGNEHYSILQERVKSGDYDGYLKYLMSYLYKVGLREGSQDFQLQVMMREARTILANVGRSDLLDIYKAFEKTAMFHEAYFQLDREGYAKILNSWGVEPLQVFKNKEANTLSVEVTRDDGSKLNDLGVIKYDDLLQSSTWSHRLTYGDKKGSEFHFDEEKVYDDMLVTLLYGGEDQACRIIDNEVINLVSGVKVADLSDRLVVDGDDMSLESLIKDSRYMAGIAHDMWRLDGRCANVLDDVSVAGAVGLNKDLLTTWKIRRYAEEYGFVPTWMFEALSLDNFIYEIENYKDLVGAGMKKLFKGKGGDGMAVAQLVNDHLKRRRVLRGEEFRTNYLPIEDVRLLSRKTFTLKDAEIEYVRRQKLAGNVVDVNNADYKMQIELLHKKWSTNVFSASERAQIDAVDWKRVNAEYAEELGVESIGDTFDDFIKNFSFGRLSATEKFRGTDLKDYGGYFLKSGAVVDIFKSGFAGGATEAVAKIFGTMEGYLPYDSSGLRRFIKKEMEVMYSWDDKKWSVEVPKEEVKKGANGELVDGNMDGKRLPNGELMMDENGFWVSNGDKDGKTTTTKMLYGDSLIGKSRMRKSRNERDIEYAVYSMVGSGTMDRETAEEFLDSKYGGIFKGNKYSARTWRWMKRWLTLDDPLILFEAAWDDGKKAVGGFFKYIFG